jgi:hypothetical protein
MPRFVCAYDYRDQYGMVRYQVVRWQDPKSFSQRAPDKKGGGGWQRDQRGKLTMQGVEMIPYKLDLVAAASIEFREHGVVRQLLIVEGERDVDRLVRGGFLASCNPGGAGKWDPSFGAYFRNFEVALIADADQVGRQHMADVARSVLPVAALVKLIDLRMTEPGQDFSDWADAGGTPRGLKALIAAAPPLTLADLPPEPAAPKRPARALPDRLSPYARTALSARLPGDPRGSERDPAEDREHGIVQHRTAGRRRGAAGRRGLQHAAQRRCRHAEFRSAAAVAADGNRAHRPAIVRGGAPPAARHPGTGPTLWLIAMTSARRRVRAAATTATSSISPPRRNGRSPSGARN